MAREAFDNAPMHSLSYQLKLLCRHNRDGAAATQANRRYFLQMFARDLKSLGFFRMQVGSLKAKHVEALIEKYKKENLSIGTLKNRLSVLRWWAEKIGKPHVVAKENSDYGIGAREYVAKESKGQQLDLIKLEQIDCPYVKMSLELQAAFGLRREESIKFIPTYADQENHLHLKSSWSKGGKERVVPIRTEAQREVLNKAHQLAKGRSLIPEHLSYVDQMKRYEKRCLKVGLHKMHGLRHAYAQSRYEEITEWKAPVCGGLTSKQLTPEQKQKDLKARLIISVELGHKREQITVNYLGR